MEKMFTESQRKKKEKESQRTCSKSWLSYVGRVVDNRSDNNETNRCILKGERTFVERG